MQKKNVREWACTRLISAAEALIAERGINGASLRAISAAAGHSNNFAAQYHFKTKDALWKEIYRRRTEEIERRRDAYLKAALSRRENPTLSDLLGHYLRPYADLVDKEGRCTHARFLLHLITDREGWRYAMSHGPDKGETTPTGQILRRMQALLDAGSPGDFQARLAAATRMFLMAVVLRDHDEILGRPTEVERQRHVEMALDLCLNLVMPARHPADVSGVARDRAA